MKWNWFVKLKISGHGLNIEEITKKLKQEPDYKFYEGESYTSKYDNTPITYKEDCWIKGTEKKGDETVENTIERFLSDYTHSASYLQELAGKFNVILCISVYPDEEQSSIHLSTKVLKLISDMGMSIDFDASFLKKFYDGSYTESVY